MRYLFFVLLVYSALSVAEKSVPDELAPVPEPPTLPKPVQDNEAMELETVDIKIFRKGKEIIQEFRKNGLLYMVKVIPDAGPAYYFIDSNGDGRMDVRRNDMDRNLDINQWKLFEWN